MNKETAVLAGGCFWCTEAIFLRLKGVISVVPGYAGGTTKNPTYEQVCSGGTGHAEAIKVEFDPTVISFNSILDVFWHTHDPTTKDRQGNDVGTQYRSAIFYTNDQQKMAAEASKKKLEEDKTYRNPIVTEIVPLTEFFEAEDYHHNYYENNSTVPYCRIVIGPKIHKLMERIEVRDAPHS